MNLKSIFLIIAVLITTQSCQQQDFVFTETSGAVYQGSTLEYLEGQEGTFDSLYKVLGRLDDLRARLQDGKNTFFLPTNNSFKLAFYNMNKVRTARGVKPLYINEVDSAQLDTLLSKYLVKGVFVTDSVSKINDGIVLRTLKYDYPMHAKYDQVNASGLVEGGAQYLTYSDTKESDFIQYWIRTTTKAVNIKTDNGIVHILSPNHDFGFNEFMPRLSQ